MTPVPYWKSDCGRAVIYLGECENILPKLSENQFHAVITDPPYNLTFMGEEWDNKGSGHDFQKWFMTCAEAMLQVAKPGAHLLSFGGTRMWHRIACAIEDAGFEMRDTIMWVYSQGFPKNRGGDIGKIVGVKQWEGWGTVLKPAIEPIIMARKPLVGKAIECVLENGCGGINIDGCRVGTDVVGWSGGGAGTGKTWNESNCGLRQGGEARPVAGRWPTNLIHDGSDEATRLFPEGADRYFYSAKADHTDRAHGGEVAHPTVKPLDLMRYLVRLVCAKGTVVLDPFAGSGSTICAAIEEGVYGVGIERSKEYADIAVDRLKETLGVHPRIERLVTGKRIVKDTPPPPQVLR
jgi:DNA modification methylase